MHVLLLSALPHFIRPSRSRSSEVAAIILGEALATTKNSKLSYL